MRLFITAGEPSGDRLGAALIDGLRQLAGEVELRGVGGAQMAEQGLQSAFPMEELSLMGIAEVLPRCLQLKRRIAETASAAAAMKPDALITIDSPDFSLRVAAAARKLQPDLHTVHYVAPTVWAWRPGRARRMAGLIDQVLALFPFEPPYFEAEGIRCDFVGHPIAAEPPPDEAEIDPIRRETAGGEPVIAVLAGSRRSEVSRLAPIFGETLRRVAERHPGARVVAPTMPHLEGLLREAVGSWPGRPIILTDNGSRRAALRVSDVALAKSGTVSLELAAAGVPMVIGYDVNWISRAIIGGFLKIDTVTLVNIVTESRVVPEFLGRDCRPEKLAPALLRLIDAPGEQREALEMTMQRLGRGREAPGLRAARAVISGLSA